MDEQLWKIEWDDGMSVGIPEIDEDHRHFIALVNGLNQAITDRMELAEIRNRLRLIVDDATQHFNHEERLFREWQYPNADSHAGIHAHVINVLQEIREKFIPYGLDAEWIDAGLRIKGTLINHILMEDMKYAIFCRDSCAGKPDGRS